MALAVVDICNMALSHVGKGTIQSIDERSPEAAECRRWYEQSRQQSLESLDWSFARVSVALAVSPEDPPETWQFRYIYPDQCLKFRKIQNPLGLRAPQIPFMLQMNAAGNIRTILTNMEDAIGWYTFDQMSPALFTPAYVDALSRLLAHRIAYKLTGKSSLAREQLQMYNGLIRVAGALDANEQAEEEPRDADWIESREGRVYNRGTYPYWMQ
jgi:hypothetical protein